MLLNSFRSLQALVILFSLALFSFQASGDENLASGTFKGASGHSTSGSVTVVKSENGLQVVLGDDFKFDGAPDARVGFGKNGKYDSKSHLELLRSNKGGQVYLVPASLDIDEYNEIYIWCKQYSVSLGVAKIE
jgi:hypothetical protein